MNAPETHPAPFRSRWAEWAPPENTGEIRTGGEPTEPTKPGSVSFGGAIPARVRLESGSDVLPCIVCGGPVSDPAALFCPVDWSARLRRSPRLCGHRTAFLDPKAKALRCGACGHPVTRKGTRYLLTGPMPEKE